MSHPLLEKHRATLEGALHAIATRGYWSAYNEMPSPKAYGETAAEDGKRAFDAHLGEDFALGQPGQTGWQGGGESPYGIELNVTYPVCDIDALIAAGEEAMPGWQAVGADGRTGICLEILDRLNRQSFELAHAVMMTTGQGWMMAFQAGAPHAQERGLEAIAYAYREQRFVPHEATWEKPQGKNPPLVLKKHFEIVGRGVGVVVGCGTFPTWNTYPGLFAALSTGNPVIVKPHGNAILPAAITVRTIRAVLAENGIDPNLVTLCVPAERETTQKLVTHPAVKSVDFTGGNVFGRWLLDHCRQAQVYAELAGVNNIVVDSTDAYKRMLGNLAFTLALYSGQMCTTAQAILVPADGIDTDDGHKSFDDFCADLARAVTGFLAKPEVAHAVLGAIQSADTLQRIEEAGSGMLGTVILAPTRLENPGPARLRRRRRGRVHGGTLRADRLRRQGRRHRRRHRAVRAHHRHPRRADRRRVLDPGRSDRGDDRRHLAVQSRAVDQPDRRRLREPVGGLLRLSRHRRQPGGQRLVFRFGLRRQPLPRRPAALSRLRKG